MKMATATFADSVIPMMVSTMKTASKMTVAGMIGIPSHKE